MASSLGALAAVPADVEGTRFEEPIQVLQALKIMIGDGDGNFRPDDTIIRSEVAKMAVVTMGLDDAAEAAAGVTNFYDVPADHWASGYINVAVAQGLIVGDGDGNFRPNDTITYAEAMTIMVRATGYEPAAESKGGFPSGFIATASSNGLTKNVQGSVNEPITRGNVAYLTSNALEVNLMEQKGFGQNAVFEITDKTLLKDKLSVTKGSGQITAIENTAINGTSSLTNGQIMIDDNVYETAYNMNNLFAYNVDYYVREESNGDEVVILAMAQKDKNSTFIIQSDLFEGVTEKNGNKAIEYYKTEQTSKTSTVELNSEATLIYNGRYAQMSDELLDISDRSGNITLLDTDRDGKYNVVFVTNYTNIVVEEVTATNKIIDKYGLPTLKLDDDNVSYRITLGGSEIELSELREFDVLSVAASLDGELLDINVSREAVEGKITASNDKGYYVNGTHYKVASNYNETLNIGLEGTFFLDIDGRIAAVDTTGQLSTNYAYLTNAYITQGDDVPMFKLFTRDAKEITVEANEKIRLNGKSGQSARDVIESLKTESSGVNRQLVTYTLNSDGKLTALNTAADNTATGAANLNAFTMNYKLTDTEYNASTGKLGAVRITDSTVIFSIPDGAAVSEYEILDKSVFEDKQKYNALVYDRTDDFTAKAIVLTNAELTTNADSPIAVVSGIATAVNDDDERTDHLTAFVNGEEIELFAEEEGILSKDGGKLEKGDIIQYKLNSNGEIASIRVLLDVSAKETEKEETPVEYLDIVYGKVTKKFADSVNVSVNGGDGKNFSLPKDVIVYCVDTTISKNNVTVGTTGDIQAYDEDENNRVFIKIYKDVVQEVVVIK